MLAVTCEDDLSYGILVFVGFLHIAVWIQINIDNCVAYRPERLIAFYSETTWAVGIAQLTHHEVRGGGKNPETGGRGIFAPTADRVGI